MTQPKELSNGLPIRYTKEVDIKKKWEEANMTPSERMAAGLPQFEPYEDNPIVWRGTYEEFLDRTNKLFAESKLALVKDVDEELRLLRKLEKRVSKMQKSQNKIDDILWDLYELRKGE